MRHFTKKVLLRLNHKRNPSFRLLHCDHARNTRWTNRTSHRQIQSNYKPFFYCIGIFCFRFRQKNRKWHSLLNNTQRKNWAIARTSARSTRKKSGTLIWWPYNTMSWVNFHATECAIDFLINRPTHRYNTPDIIWISESAVQIDSACTGLVEPLSAGSATEMATKKQLLSERISIMCDKSEWIIHVKRCALDICEQCIRLKCAESLNINV